jgi:cell fate regulator YaaT (PSP1 superfamily)
VRATRLVIVGAEEPTDDVREFLDLLSGLVPLRIEYRQISL